MLDWTGKGTVESRNRLAGARDRYFSREMAGCCSRWLIDRSRPHGQYWLWCRVVRGRRPHCACLAVPHRHGAGALLPEHLQQQLHNVLLYPVHVLFANRKTSPKLDGLNQESFVHYLPSRVFFRDRELIKLRYIMSLKFEVNFKLKIHNIRSILHTQAPNSSTFE